MQKVEECVLKLESAVSAKADAKERLAQATRDEKQAANNIVKENRRVKQLIAQGEKKYKILVSFGS